MAITYAKFFPPAVIGTSVATRYTVPATPTNVLLRGARVSLTNATGSSVTPTLYAVPSGGTAGTSNVFYNQAIGPFQTVYVDVPVMGASDFLQDKCDTASAVTIQPIAGGLFS